MAKINPAQEAELKHLNRMVNIRQDEAYSREPQPDAQSKLYYARKDLKEFVSRLRQDGVDI